MTNLIHLAPCKRCPSAHYPPDPEAEDWKAAPKQYRLSDGLFVCAWRPSKVCKGLCDFLELTEEDVAKQAMEHSDSATGQMVARMNKHLKEQAE